MKILLDHCIDWRMKRLLPSHSVKSTAEMHWEDLQNGKLLAAAGPSFDLFLTVDQNIKSQQNLSSLPISIVVLISKSNRLEELQPLIPEVERAILSLRLGQLIEIGTTSTVIIAPGRDRA